MRTIMVGENKWKPPVLFLDHRKSKGIKKKKICFCFIDYATSLTLDHNKQ